MHLEAAKASAAPKKLDDQAATKDEKRKAYFSKGSDIVASFEKSEKECSEEHLIKGKLIVQARGKLSKVHSFTNEVAFEHIYLHLILSGYVDPADLERLNSLNMLFGHMCKMIKHMKP